MGKLGRAGRQWLAIALIVGLFTAACGDDDDDDTGGDDETTTTVGEDGDGADTSDGDADGDEGGTAGGTLVAAQGSEPDRFDPHLTTAYASFQILENVYDTLVQPGDDLTMEPALATEWTTSDDQLTWTFTLREGVTFHNGRELTADDVVYSLERIRDPEVSASTSYRLDAVDTITAVDPLTVEIVTSRPTPNLLVLLGGYKGMAIVPEEIVEDGSIDTAPVGTGPFVFVSYDPGSGVVLEKNADYWRADEGLPYLDEVRFMNIPDPTVMLANLETGEVDWIDSVPPNELESLEGSDDVTLGRVPGSDYHYFALNQEREPFDDPLVRQAIAMAIDRDEITEAATFGAATVNQSAIPEGNFWYHDYTPYEAADIEGAEALLEEAGAADGFPIEFLVTSDNPETVTQAQVIQAELEPLGIDVEIRDVDFGTWLDEQGSGNFDAFMLSWVGNIDPDEFYYAQHHTDGGFNFQGYSNPDLDQILDDARVETDQDARKELYDEAAEIIVDDASYIYLYNPDNIDAWGPSVEGYQVRGDNAIRFVETSISS